MRKASHTGSVAEAIIAPWVNPTWKPPPGASPQVKDYATKVATILGRRPPGTPSRKPASTQAVSKPATPGATGPPIGRPASAPRVSTSPPRVPWDEVKNHFDSLRIADRPRPERAEDAVREVHDRAVKPVIDTAAAAMRDGIWQTDQSRHAQEGVKVIEGDPRKGTILVPTPEGAPKMRVAYFFSGTKRRASIGECLAVLCRKAGIGLVMHEVDTMVGGKAHNLLDKAAQEDWLSRIHDGDFDMCIHSPPCASWSRAPFSDDKPPQPVRNKAHPWGIPWLLKAEQDKARDGNEFVHFTLRALAAAKQANDHGHRVRSLWEHPEDLGRTHRGVPASVWQLKATREAFAGREHVSVAGHQCQFDHEGVPYDCKKPTRLYTDIVSFRDFGYPGWPTFDGGDNYTGPLPRDCGHKHERATIGRNADGGFNTSPLAAYPGGMCLFIARHCLEDFLKALEERRAPRGLGGPSKKARSEFGNITWAPPQATTDTSNPSASSNTSRFYSLNVNPIDDTRIECRWTPNDITKDEIETATREAEARGVNLPLKDGLGEFSDPRRKLDPADWPTTDEETEQPGVKRPPKGAGWWGDRAPLRALKKGVARLFTDGAGFASPGRWRKSRRNLPHNDVAKEIRKIFLRGLRKAEPHLPGKSFKSGLHAAAGGKLEACPFPEELLEEIRADLRVVLMEFGYGDALPHPGDVQQKIEVRLAQALLEAFKDPDACFCNWWATGAWLGSAKRKLPRTPCLYDRKVRWALPTSAEELHGEWQVNYSSLREHRDQVQTQFEQEEKEGLMRRTTLKEALARWGDQLRIAGTGAIAKKGGVGEVRVIFDGSNGILVNTEIIVRDQIRFPTADDIKVVLKEMHAEQKPCFTLLFDVSKAHRRMPIVEEEWGRQACQVRGSAAEVAQRKRRKEGDAEFKRRIRGASPSRVPLPPNPMKLGDFTEAELGEDLWLNLVGTFGVASAGYWWGRAGGALIRLTHYINGLEHAIWSLLYSDDGWSVGQGDRADVALLLQILMLSVLGVPLAWHKLRGGSECEWVGYWMDLSRFRLGISSIRAAWAVRWLNEKATEGRARLGELREGLGRLQFIAGPMEHLRPFLGPLYAWCAAGPRFAQPRLPVMVILVLRYLAKELQDDHATDYRQYTADLGEVFRLDAAAKGHEVSVGGWRTGKDGNTREAVWFAERLTRATAPWAFERGEPFRTIASLELLGVLMGIMLLTEDVVPSGESMGVVALSCGTDNQGNTFLLDKLLTTKFPLVVILMELAHQLRKRRLVLRADWLPRLQNQEADDLTNGEFSAFTPSKRIRADLRYMSFAILPELFAEGSAYVEGLEAQRAKEKQRIAAGGPPASGPGARKRKPAEALRVRDPWP